MAEFFPNTKISSPQHLFGRDKELKTLEDYAKSMTQIQIIGARRFGKTTISLCLETLLREDTTSNIYPLYTDVKTNGITGTDNFYRYLISSLVERVSRDGIFTEEHNFGIVNIEPSTEYIVTYSKLMEIKSGFMPYLFKKVYSYFADKIQKTILVIFDEYEYLAKSTFENLDGFMTVRDFSTDSLDCGLRPFIFWLVGARSWGSFVQANKLSNVEVIGGSGEFNNVEIEHYLSPLSSEEFIKFWNDRCESYYGEPDSDEILAEKELIKSYAKKAYNSVSGVPFYGGSIAKHIKARKAYPDYTIIKAHLDEALNIFDKSTIELLRKLCEPSFTERNDDYDLLNNYGFINIAQDGKTSVAMDFLREYLIKLYQTTETNKTEVLSTNKQATINKLVEGIDDLIENINETCRNKKIDAVFYPSGEERTHRKVMTTICNTETDFGTLLATLAKVYYERSKALDSARNSSIPGQRLAEIEPSGRHDYKSRKFFKILEPLRTYYGAHLKDKVERKPYQLDKGEALFELQGHKNEPDSPDSWYELQLKMLRLFKSELNTIKQKVNNLP